MNISRNIYICDVGKSNTTQDLGLTAEKLISVVIVNYKSWKDLNLCLSSLQQVFNTGFAIEVIVVDNDELSSQRTEFSKKFADFSFVANSGNNGFANGCNFGAQLAKGNYLLFLNPDTEISEKALESMRATLEANTDFGIVSCVQKNKADRKEKEMRFFPRLATLFGTFRTFYKLFTKKTLEAKYHPSKKIVFPDWVSGSLVMITKEWFERVKGWNEDYWMYFEDVDLSKKVSDHGGKVALLRDVSIVHNHGGASRINVSTSSITKSQVLISKHVYVRNNFNGLKRFWIQTLLVLYVLIIKLSLALVGGLLFFVPSLRVNFLVYLAMLRYYKRSLEYRTWFSIRSMRHPLNRNLKSFDKDIPRIGYDAKRVFHNFTGLGNYSRDLVAIMSAYFRNCQYFLYNPKPKKIDRLEQKENLIEILPVLAFWKRNSSVWRQGPVVKQLIHDRVRLFHGLSGEIPRGLKESGIKSVVTIHDLIFIRYPKLYSFIDRRIHFRKFQRATKEADVVIAISEQTKRDVVDFLGIDPEKIKVVYQGCHPLFKQEMSEDWKIKVRENYQLPEKYILNVGTIESRKNLLTAVKAIKDLDVVLVVVGGKTSYFKEIEKYIAREGLQDKVRFLNQVNMESLVAIYQMASLFLYPSIFEGFGIPIIEALYSKVPVITSTGSCFAEAGGPNSIYVDPMDVAAFSKQIETVLNSAELREEMIEKGYEFVQKFNDQTIALEIMEIYKSLL